MRNKIRVGLCCCNCNFSEWKVDDDCVFTLHCDFYGKETKVENECMDHLKTPSLETVKKYKHTIKVLQRLIQDLLENTVK